MLGRTRAVRRNEPEVTNIPRFKTAAFFAALTLFVAPSAQGQMQSARHHDPGCNTSRCDHKAGVLYALHHRPKFHVGLFERCVFNRESGTGSSGPWTLSTIKWTYDDGLHEGAANWLNSTWLSMGGGKYARRAADASPRQQTLIFRAHATEPGQWDETVPPCLQYRGLP